MTLTHQRRAMPGREAGPQIAVAVPPHRFVTVACLVSGIVVRSKT
jgi:hypothetical protein